MMILWKSKLQYKWIQIYGFMFPVTYQGIWVKKKAEEENCRYVWSAVNMFSFSFLCGMFEVKMELLHFTVDNLN